MDKDVNQIGRMGQGVPAVSPKQQRFFGAELARKRAGKKTQTGLSENKLSEMATKPKGGYPGKTGAGGGGDNHSTNPYYRSQKKK